MRVVSPNLRLRYPDAFRVGDSVIDDWGYFSVRVEVGDFCHVGPLVSAMGGPERLLLLADFAGIAAGARLFCGSDDFVNDLAGIFPAHVDAAGPLGRTPIVGDVTMGRGSVIGANTVVLPDNRIPEGTAIGAQSLVPPRFAFEPWLVYAGIPIRPIARRNRERVEAQMREVERRCGRA